MVAAIGIGVLLLAQVILFFSHFDTISSSNKAGAIFGLLGHLALIIGLTLASLLQTSLSWGVRTALLLGAAFFVLGLGGFSNLPGF